MTVVGVYMIIGGEGLSYLEWLCREEWGAVSTVWEGPRCLLGGTKHRALGNMFSKVCSDHAVVPKAVGSKRMVECCNLAFVHRHQYVYMYIILNCHAAVSVESYFLKADWKTEIIG